MYCARSGAGATVAVAVASGVDVGGIGVGVDSKVLAVGGGDGLEHELRMAAIKKNNRNIE